MWRGRGHQPRPCDRVTRLPHGACSEKNPQNQCVDCISALYACEQLCGASSTPQREFEANRAMTVKEAFSVTGLRACEAIQMRWGSMSNPSSAVGFAK